MGDSPQPRAERAGRTPLEPLLSVPQTAALFGVCDKTIWKLIRARELQAVKIGARVLIEPDAARAYKRERATALVAR